MWTSDRLSAAAGVSVVCWDLDSTVRSTMQRRWLVPDIRAGRATWDDYSALAADDVPVEGAVALMRLLQLDHLNFAVSACSDNALDITVAWAAKHRVPLDEFLLRPAGGLIDRDEWKVSCIERLREAGLAVKLFVEDWAPTARYIRERTGVPVLGVNPFDGEAVLLTQQDLADGLEHRIGPEGLAAEPGSGLDLAGDVLGYLRDKLCL